MSDSRMDPEEATQKKSESELSEERKRVARLSERLPFWYETMPGVNPFLEFSGKPARHTRGEREKASDTWQREASCYPSTSKF